MLCYPLTCPHTLGLTSLQSVGASISNDGKLVSVSSLAVGFDIYSMGTADRIRRFAYNSETRALPSRFTSDDQHLVCGGENGKACIREVLTGKNSQLLPHLGKSPSGVPR